jgi:hypothetical protein
MKKSTKELLFERMHKIGGMPLNEVDDITLQQNSNQMDSRVKNSFSNIENELITIKPKGNQNINPIEVNPEVSVVSNVRDNKYSYQLRLKIDNLIQVDLYEGIKPENIIYFNNSINKLHLQ